VVVSDRDQGNADAVAASIVQDGGRSISQCADVRLETDCQTLIKRAVEVYGRIDVLVNNAAISPRGNIENTSTEVWDEIFATNVRGAFICIREVVPYMKQQRAGSIINVGSINAYIGEPKLMAYAASKGALQTLTKNAASYLNRYRIRVNQINPGWTLTPNEHKAKIEEGKGEKWIEEATRTRPFGRLMYPRDIAHAALYFAGDESQVVTGSVLDLEQYPVGAPPNW
jgi:NAD(P)-dependent dehydrogenase (short-subunit alcohol dehydrogenase family)